MSEWVHGFWNWWMQWVFRSPFCWGIFAIGAVTFARLFLRVLSDAKKK
jgi:hypothetical protein